jgi:DNA topoisomerase-3
MLGLADAARSRSEADWLVGINGTRAMTAFNSRDGGFFLTTVGRVQTPTLSSWSSARRRSASTWRATTGRSSASFDAAGRQYEGKWFDPKWKKKAPDDAERSEGRPAVDRGRGARPSPTRCAASPPPSPRRPSPARRPARCCTT